MLALLHQQVCPPPITTPIVVGGAFVQACNDDVVMVRDFWKVGAAATVAAQECVRPALRCFVDFVRWCYVTNRARM